MHDCFCSHTSCRQQKIFLFLLQSKHIACLFSGNILPALPGYRNTKRFQFICWNSSFYDLRMQFFMRCNIIVAVGFFPERDTGVVCHHGHRKRQSKPISSHISNRFCRIKMWHNDRIHRIFLKIFFQIACHSGICIIHRRFFHQSTYHHSKFIRHAKHGRCFFNNLHITIPDQFWYSFSGKRQIIQHFCTFTMLADCFCDRLCRRIMSAACITG